MPRSAAVYAPLWALLWMLSACTKEPAAPAPQHPVEDHPHVPGAAMFGAPVDPYPPDAGPAVRSAKPTAAAKSATR